MKKILLMGCCVIMAICGCKSETKMSTEHVSQLDVHEVNEKIRNRSSSFLLYLTTDECYSCTEYDKVLKKLQKEEAFTIYYVVVDEEDEEELRELKMTLGNYDTLPMTYYIKRGDVTKNHIIEGYIEKDAYKTWLQKLKIVK